MATWDRNFTGGSYTGNWHTRLDYWNDAGNATTNQTTFHLRMYIWCDPGYSQTGLFVPRGRIGPGGEYGGNVTRTINNGSGFVLVASWDGTYTHDANGELYITLGTYVNAPVNDMAWADIGWTLPKLYRAPAIAGTVADTIKPTSTRVGVEISDLGLGTSAAMRMYYRKQGDATWIATADQGDAAGYNYWTVTGLKPSTTYEYFARVWNNNGSTRDSGVQTFKTKSAGGMLPVMMGLLQ